MAAEGQQTGRGFKRSYIFYILYVIGVLGMAVMGMLGNARFAYKISEYLWADILYSLFVALLYVTAFVREVIDSRKPSDIAVNSLIFPGCLLFFLLFYYLGGIFILLAVFYSAAMILVLAFRTIVKIKKTCHVDDKNVDIKPLIATLGLLLFAMVGIMSVHYESDIYIAWALIPTAVIAVIVVAIAAILWKDLLAAKLLKVWQPIVYSLFVFAIAFCYSFTAVGVANVTLDRSAPTPIECTVLETRTDSGARTPTTHKIKVMIDGAEEWIDVPPGAYFELSENAQVIINRYSGAFGFAYYLYEKTA